MTPRSDDTAPRTGSTPSDRRPEAATDRGIEPPVEVRVRERGTRLAPEQLRAAASVLAHVQSRHARTPGAAPSS